MKISKHFNREEFTCKCGCGQDTVDKVLIDVLEDVREHFAVPVIITNGNRCSKHNAEVGGVKDSQHTKGRAADIQVKGIHSDKVYEYIDSKYPDTLGVGKYTTFTHIDSRDNKARWTKK